MVWKINKHKKSDKQGVIIKQKQVLESLPTLKSCLKKKDDADCSKFQNDPTNSKAKDQASKSVGSRSRSTKSGAALSRSSASILSIESRGSGSSPPTSCINGVRGASIEQHFDSSRSWDHESRRSDTVQSTQTSERSFADSRSLLDEKKKKVNFTVIHIRDYERVVGDNPSCTIGPPVGIGWKYGKTRVIDIETFEVARSYKKLSSHLILTREEREALLLNWGASFHDIVEAVRSNLKIKNQRRQTVTNLGKVERIEEAFESATRKLKSALMLRRSTGNKVKRLQEQANLAQSALTSLKIAEDRALSEIREARCVQIVKEPERKEELESFAMPNYGPSSTEDIKGRPSHLIIPKKEEQADSTAGHSLTGNSTTQSELEIEKFYQELELEMFGDEELPSMVGQTLEVPLKDGSNNHMMKDSMDRLEYSSVNSGMSDRDLDDALLEQEQNRSMISEYLLEDADTDSPKDHYYPAHRDQISSGNYSSRNSGNPLDFPALSGRRMDMSKIVVEHQNPRHRHQEAIPLHAGMTMFEDCALLGGQRNDKPLYREKKRHSSRSRDMNAGPKVQFIPPPNHLSPSHWMDGPDSHITPHIAHDTITIFEDDFGNRKYCGDRDRDSYAYNNNRIYPNFYCK
uniref:Uncharacterized protein n=1 Tax=Pseudo-nitzschia australis TaxID=44445 RepID=A0A7S4EEK0_9STRA|mmetsp:Transcript_4897/g.10825  ORF Transcript_4897/g.10825 Transcript_4897/m.10825 type:complete len:631 (+) Transcript_4897:380-2272(+)